ncbi:MAG: glucose-1-phosphate cytidylyltransferase [Acidobacteriota bacterium]
MKTIILCGGRGTRLREHTEMRPKPMVEIGDRPILWHIMKLYSYYGFKDFVLCLGYKGHMIKEYFLNYECMNSDFTIELGKNRSIEYHSEAHKEDGWRVTLADTGEHEMTGARIKRAARYLDGSTFCVTYGDGVSDVNLRAVLDFHRTHGKLATLTGVRPPSRFGELHCEGTSVLAFSEKPQVGQGLINGGFFCFEIGFLEYLSEDASCILEREPLEECAREGQLQVYEHQGYWQCMDTYRDWESLNRQWQANNAPWKVWS